MLNFQDTVEICVLLFLASAIDTDAAAICSDDRGSNCDDIKPFECYDYQIQSACCEICFYYKSILEEPQPDCLYGDRKLYCINISASQCYDSETENQCCGSCREFKHYDSPGCEYGDHVNGCEKDGCTEYTKERQLSCCFTCLAYLNSTTTEGYKNRTDNINEGPTHRNMNRQESQGGQNGDDPGIAVPIGGAVAGVVLVAIIIVIICFVIKKKSENVDNQISCLKQNTGSSAKSNPYLNAGLKPRSQPSTENPPEVFENHEEDVYDYINPDDVDSIISKELANCDESCDPDTEYIQPISKVANEYENSGFYKDNGEDKPRTDTHGYLILSKN